MMYHYVYRITYKPENRHYYGCRTCVSEPKNDLGVKYFSSSSDKEFITKQKSSPTDFKYKIVKICSSRAEALQVEIFLHNKFNVAKNEKFFNLANQTSTGFNTSGVSMKNRRNYQFTQEHKNKIAVALKDNKNHLGHTHTLEAKRKVSEANKNNNYNLGKKHSAETKAKIGQKSAGRLVGHLHPNSKTINVYCYKTDELIASGVTVNQWASSNNCSASALSRTLKADRSIPSSTKNPHHHKQFYILHKE